MTRIQQMESLMAKNPRFARFIPQPKPGVKQLLAAHTCSVLADRLIQMAALAIAVASASAAAATSAWILFWATLPAIFLAPLAGWTVDRTSRARLMMATDAVRAALALGLVCLLRQTTAPSVLYLGVALVASAACFFTPARLALVPTLVDKRELFKVNAWFTASAMVMTLAGTGAGSLLMHAAGIPITLGMAAALYLTSAALLATIAAPAESCARAEAHDLWRGFRVLQRHRALRRLVAFAVSFSALQAWFYVGVTKLATERFHLDILGFGGLLSALGVGLLVGAGWTHRQRQTAPAAQYAWSATSLAVIGGASLLLSMAPAFGWAALALALVGFGTAGCLTAVETLLQRAVPDRLRGRLFAARGILANLAFAGSVALAGWVTPHLPVMTWFVVAAAMAGVLSTLAWLESRQFTWLYALLRVGLRPVSWWYCRPRRVGLDRIPLTGPVLVAPNHPSRMDAALVLAYSPRRLYFLAAETNWNLWWLGWLCTQFGCVPVSKTHGNSNALHTAQQLLQQGKAVCIFPEGTISRELSPLKPGVAILAATTGAPIIPVGFCGTHEAMPPKEPLRPHPVTVAVGDVLWHPRMRGPRVPQEVIERINTQLAEAIRGLTDQESPKPAWAMFEEPMAPCAVAC